MRHEFSRRTFLAAGVTALVALLVPGRTASAARLRARVPEVIDGIHCNCGCAHADGFYSLLSCYEGKDAMARECAICQGQGRLAVRLHKAGKSLDAIRTAVDAKFG